MTNIFNGIDTIFQSAFDPANHGFLSGSWDDFQLGVNRVAGVLPTAIGNNAEIISKSAGASFNNVLSNLNSPSFFMIAGIGILGLLIFGYISFKVLKYV